MLQCISLEKKYQMGETDVWALRGVDFTVEQGEFTAIMGSSGSGKSTLLHCIGCVDCPSSGKVMVEGKDIHALNERDAAIFRRRKIGLVYQFFNLLPTLNARQNILLPLALDGRSPDEEYFNDLVDTLGLNGRLRHYPQQMSGGEQQRCAIARALITKPALCLADEPTGNLDRCNTDEIITLLREANHKFGQTIIMITHDERLAALSDRIVTIEDGKIISDTYRLLETSGDKR